MTQSVQEQVRILPAIKSEGHFFQVGREVLCADFVPCSHNAALQKRECGFNGVGVNVAHNVDVTAVLYGLVSCSRNSSSFHGEGIRGEIICENYIDILANIFSNELRNRSSLDIASMEHAKLAVTLTDSNYDFLFGSTSCESIFLGTRLSFAPDIGFVYLDLAVEHGLLRFDHCGTDAMAEIPRGLITPEAQRSLNLASRHSLFGFAKKQSSEKPCRERQMGIVENCASRYAKLIFAVRAFKFALREKARDCSALAAWARDALRPAQTLQLLAALIFRGVVLIHIDEVH